MSDIHLALLQTWLKGEALDQSYFTHDFEYFGVLNDMDASTWLDLGENELPWIEPVIIEQFSSEEKSAIVFDATDPITMLKHRISWVVVFRENKIRKLIDTFQVIPS
jgi:signal-transduction protein with cAMP-binding, CBS, and nucleotidyltransferase domain